MLDAHNEDGVLILTLNRPELKNALSPSLVQSIITALTNAGNDNATRVVILTGAPPAFCSGMDVNVFKNRHEPANSDLLNNKIREMFDAIIDFPKPIIAAVNGAGVGFGATILGLCDIVILAQSAKLVAPFASLGLGPEACSSYTFPRTMGWQAAGWFLYSSQWMDAAECKATGLALDVVPDDQLMAQVLQRAKTIAGNSIVSLMATKEALMSPRREHLREACRIEWEQFRDLLEGPAFEEGMRAFFEKRAPDYREAGL